MKRRDFMQNALAVGVAASFFPWTGSVAQETSPKKARIAFIGVGSRGTGLLRNVSRFPNAEIVAVCDLFKDRAENAAKICVDAGSPAPTVYTEDENTWKTVYEKEKFDAVVISTYWDSHAEMSDAAMKRGIYVGCEVPIAMTVDDCWRLVETSERTKIPCMMLENWSFRQDNLALLNMIGLGMLGEMMHGHGAYSHYGIGSYKTDGHGDTWRNRYIQERNLNCNYYPTHALGPILSWFDINVGDRFTEIYSVATAAKGVNDFVRRNFGPDHPNATKKFTQGDVITSILKTAGGKSIVINLDTRLPRPYANRWLAAGTRGVYDEEKGSIYLDGVSPAKEKWEPWAPYQEKYNHRFWQQASTAGGHMGTDPLMLKLFVDSVVAKEPAPLDVYDSVVMSAVVELSGKSIAENRPVEFPDFTNGAWKTRKPYFALDRLAGTS